MNREPMSGMLLMGVGGGGCRLAAAVLSAYGDGVRALGMDTDALSIRRLALAHKIPFFTLLTAARAGIQAMRAMNYRQMDVKPIQSYFLGEENREAAE